MSSSDMNKRKNEYERLLRKNEFLYAPIGKMNIYTNDVMANVSTYVLAPSLTSFIIWTLRNAMNKKIKRLYFLARDGYLMYQIALLFCEKLHLPIECKYLSCSRYSLRIPAFHLDTEDALEYICRDSIEVNMTKILKRAALTKEERAEVIRTLSIDISETESIPYARLAVIRQALRENELFMKFMIAHSRQAFPGLQGYLKQEGMLEEVDYALVDSGWVGSMQKSFNQMLQHLGRTKQVEGYYWGLYELPVGVDASAYHAYYFTPDSGLAEKVYFSNCLFEGIFSAPHGMTLWYEKCGGIYQPCYGGVSESKRVFILQIEAFIREYVEVLLGTASVVLSDDLSKVSRSESNLKEKGLGNRDDTNRDTIRKLLRCFMGRPTKQEVEVFGNQLFADDVLEDDTQPIAACFDGRELRAHHVLYKVLVMFGIRKEYLKESAWYEGSAVRAGRHVRYHLFQNVLYKYLLYIRKTYLWRRNG